MLVNEFKDNSMILIKCIYEDLSKYMIIITLQFTDDTALILALGKGYPKIAEILLQHSTIDVNLQNQHGKY